MPTSSPSASPSHDVPRVAVADPEAPIAPDAEPPAADVVTTEPASAYTVEAPASDTVSGPRAASVSVPAMPAANVTRVGFAPILRVDAPRREVELCATSEAIDTYGTVFDYAASKDAFHRWIGNVREMHERRAVGTRVAVRFDDPARRIYVTVRVSLGAQDTWEKILDGTLRGASIGASNVTWERQVRRVSGHTRALDVATHYDLVELSLVDNPSNPDALGISIVRDAVPDLAVLAPLDYTPIPSLKRAARIPVPEDVEEAHEAEADEPDSEMYGDEPAGSQSADRDALQQPVLRGFGQMDHAQASERTPVAKARQPRRARPAPPAPTTTTRARGPFSDNAEGYPDTGVPARAEERPTDALGMDSDGQGNVRERLHAAALGVLRGCGCPLCQGAIAALGEAGDGDSDTAKRSSEGAHASVTAMRDAALARAVAAGLTASAGRLDRVDEAVRGLKTLLQAGVNQMAGTMGDLRLRIETLKAQPMPGGPAARAVAVEKTHPLAPDAATMPIAPDVAEQYRALESLAGRLTDPQAQIAVAAEMIRLRRG